MNKTIRGFAAVGAAILFVLTATGCGAPKPVSVEGKSFEEIREMARGTKVSFHMWGGDARINEWVDQFVAEAVEERYGIELVRIPMDAPVFVNKLIAEKQAGRETGVMDLLWINGENFKRLRQQDLLYGPFLDRLPNAALVRPEDVSHDFGFPTDGYEAPYGKAQFVFEYDSAKVMNPPADPETLLAWVRANPGKFTYPKPPDFTGSAFIRQLFYSVTGGHQQYLGEFNRTLFENNAPALWAYLRELSPYLWQEGRSYPADKARLDELFISGEVDFNMSYQPSAAQARILDGRYPATVRTFVWRSGSISNVHFTAIPYNAPNKAGAMVVSNFLMSTEAQLSKNDPANWGDFTVLDMNRLPEAARADFAALNLGPATLPLDILHRYAVPEIAAEYVEALEDGWEREVLGRR